ncbi:hypothetical protein FRC16_008353, partial [Serendipita sp. 398]
ETITVQSVPTMPIPHLPHATLDHISLEFRVECSPREVRDDEHTIEFEPLRDLVTEAIQKLFSIALPRHLPHCFGTWNKILHTETVMADQIGRYFEKGLMISENQGFHENVMAQFRRLSTVLATQRSDILKTVDIGKHSREIKSQEQDYSHKQMSLIASEKAQLLQFASGAIFHATIRPKRIPLRRASSPPLSFSKRHYGPNLQYPDDLTVYDMVNGTDAHTDASMMECLPKQQCSYEAIMQGMQCSMLKTSNPTD